MSRKAVEAALLEDQRRFLGFLVSRLRNVDDAMDVMQDFAARAIARADDLRDIASLRGWLSRLLATTLADHQRKSSRRRQREMSAEVESETLDILAEPDAEIDAAQDALVDAKVELGLTKEKADAQQQQQPHLQDSTSKRLPFYAALLFIHTFLPLPAGWTS
mgnify:CR=1 FL=1